MTQSITGLSELAAAYGAIICDIWGVVHDGQKAFEPACEALIRFREGGKPVLLLSNAPRPGGIVQDLLDRLGVPRQAYDAILTSGDLTRSFLEARPGVRLYHLGPARDLPLYDRLDLGFVPPEAAQYIVCTGPFDDERESAEDYRARFTEWAGRRTPLICANPDRVVERGPRLIPCAGALAELYEQLGGPVVYFGKPHQEAYRGAFALVDELARRTGGAGKPILAIGDAIATDLAGAAASGIDALFIAGGIHAALAGSADAIEVKTLKAAFDAALVKPVALMWRLSW